MTNEERKARARANREAKRTHKLETRSAAAVQPNYDKEILYARLLICGIDCCKGIGWKTSTQVFRVKLLTSTYETMMDYLNGTWRPHPYLHFPVLERGKWRMIDAAPIVDRQLHKELCRYILVPLYSYDTIYDNGACLKGRGYDYAIKNFERELVDYYKHYGTRGWYIKIDFDDYFPNADHSEIKARHAKFVRDQRVCAVLDCITDHIGTHPSARGLPLGVELSQVEMVALANGLDNYAKCQMGLKYYGRYMDDIHIIVPPDRDPEQVLAELVAKAESMHLVLNKEKTKILPLTGKIPFCKATFRYTENGAVIRHGSRRSIQKAMHKIDVFARKVKAGTMTVEEARAAIRSSAAYFEHYDDHERHLRISRKFYSVFGEPLIPPKHKKK